MIAEIGHFALILALGIAAFQSVVPLVGAHRGNREMIASAVPAALIQVVLIYVAFAALTNAYVTSDFSVQNVFENSHSAKPLLYKISGVWGNHEGSLLLWVFILASFGAAVALFSDNLPPTLKARVLAVQGSIGFAFLLFMVMTSNPFTRLDPVPIEGRGLNPLLQDPALAFHPPFLYVGYVGLSITFSFAIAALIDGKIDAAWARWVRPWTLVSWMFLFIGISMGSWWAYYELGWGGWWFWDPVENSSFMPWLVATALLHSAIVVEKRNALKVWTVLLCILAFSLSLLGTFLVRSGVLTSVHAFAVDPKRGLFILGMLFFFIGGALTLFAWRAPALKAGGFFQPISREGGLVLNNLFLCAACAAVLIGTLYPLALETVTGQKISVGYPYFNLTFVPIMLPLLLLVPVGALLSWKRADLLAVLQRLWAAAALAAGAGLLVLVLTWRGPWLAPFAMALGVWLIFGSLIDLANRIALLRVPFAASLSRLAGLPRSNIGMILAHAGVGVMIVGMVAMSVWRVENILAMKPGDRAEVGGYSVEFKGETPLTGENFTGRAGRFRIYRGGLEVADVVSEKREFKPRGIPTTEVGLYQTLGGDVYIAMGDKTSDGGRVVRIYYSPLISLLWLGALIMFVGGALSLSDRRYRVGVPRRALVSAGVPAE